MPIFSSPTVRRICLLCVSLVSRIIDIGCRLYLKQFANSEIVISLSSIVETGLIQWIFFITDGTDGLEL